jgi:serine carboxypeptidase-like clade 2
MQGGPGCSGLYNLLSGNGPWVIQEDGTLRVNEFAWNRLANVLYVDALVGVNLHFRLFRLA